jgi:two-component system sensor histidine kinase VanS
MWTAIFTLGLCLLFAAALIIGTNIVWQPGPVYDFLSFLLRNTFRFFMICWAIGFVLLFIGFSFRTMVYLVNENRHVTKDAELKKNDMIVYLAHDLKTPLTSVVGYLRLLNDEADISDESRRKYTAVALEKAERLEELIDEFFDITRFSLASMELELGEVSLTRMLEQITYEFKPIFAEKNMTCELSFESELMIRCDGNKMRRVFDNLIRNAVNYGKSGTAVSVSGGRAGGFVTLSIRNAGKTIAPEKLERLFEQFYRADEARSTGAGGAGLGLAIAKEIVGLHGGTITASSRDEMIEFRVVFPDKA